MFNGVDGAFNQPGTYVGLQYVQRNPDLPPLEGIQNFIKENERIRKEHEAYQKLASPDDKNFLDLMEKNAGKGLTGQMDQLSSDYSRLKKEFFTNFKGDEVFSDGAKSHVLKMTSEFGAAAFNELQQNQDLWKTEKTRMEKEEVGGSIWTDGQYVIVEMQNGERRPVPLSIYSEAIEDPEQAKKIRALTNSEALDWKDKTWRRGEANRFAVGNQMSMKSVLDFVDKQFVNLGHTSSGGSGEQFADLSSYLSAQGINVANGNVIQQVSTKFKDNQGQLGQVMQRIYETLPPEAKSALIAQMLSKGESPTKQIKIKTPEGEVEVSNLALNLQNIVSTSAGAKRISESERNTGMKPLSSALGSQDDSGGVIDYFALIMNSPTLAPGSKNIKFWDPSTGEEIMAPNVPILHEKVKEKIPGINNVEFVRDDRDIFLNGTYLSAGRGNDSRNPRAFATLKGGGDVTFVNQPMVDSDNVPVMVDGKQQMESIAMVRREAVINTATMDSFNGELKIPLFDTKGIFSSKGINGAEAQVVKMTTENIAAKYGLDENEKKLIDQVSGSTYVLTYWQPVRETELRGDNSNPLDNKILNYQYFKGIQPLLINRDNKISEIQKQKEALNR